MKTRSAKNKGKRLQNSVRDILRKIPNDRIFVETDSPFLAPMPHRGKRNEPSYVNYTLEKISQIKNIKKDELTKITTKNFFTLCNFPLR